MVHEEQALKIGGQASTGLMSLGNSGEPDEVADTQVYSQVKYHPLHSKNNSVASVDVSSLATTPKAEPLTPTRKQAGLSQLRSLSAKDIKSPRSSRSLLRSQSYRSTPSLLAKEAAQDLAPRSTQPLPPTLTTDVSNPVSSARHSVRSHSTGQSEFLSEPVGLAGLRTMLAQKLRYDENDIDNTEERRSLFDEVSFNSAPGNLHLLSDNAIVRFVARYGVVNVVRQLATDLAQRESEVFLVRKQQEDRERELKKMLAQCGVSMADVDKRLLNMTATSIRRPKEVLDELLQEAITEEQDYQEAVELSSTNNNTNSEATTTHQDSVIANSPSPPNTKERPMKQKSWAQFFLGGTEDKKPKNLPVYTESICSEGDAASLYSAETSTPSHHEEVDKRSVLSSNSTKTASRRKSSSHTYKSTDRNPRSIKEQAPTPTSTSENRRPVELDEIVPQNIQPPTLLPSWNNYYGVHDMYLTDRFGFIYDRHKSSSSPRETTEADSPAAESKKENAVDITKQRTSVKIDEDAEAGIRVLSSSSYEPEIVSQHATALLSKDGMPGIDPPKGPNSVRMLLAQLTDMHDTLQKAQTVRWDEFLSKLNSVADAEPSDFIQNGTELLGVSGTELAGATDNPSGIFSMVSGPNVLYGKKKKRSPKEGKQLWREFKTLVLGGIPIVYRSKIWSECSGSYVLKIPGAYQSLVDRDDESDAILQIDLDLYRTMPYNVFFGNSGPGVHKLRRVLVAFSRRNPEVGYCQGMNLIAAMLLLVFATEEDAFWLLVSLVENILPAGYFSPPLLTSRADQRVFNQLFGAILPALSSHLSSINVEVEAITFDWFLSCFTNTLPPDVLFRVWDAFLCVEGEVYLFRIALALFKVYESALMKLKSASEVYTFMKQLNNQPVRVEALIKEAENLSQPVNNEDVRKRRSEEVKILLEEFTNV